MARVVVIFAILSLITGAMFWLAQHPLTHNDGAVTVPATSPKPAAEAANTPAPADAVPSGSDTLPPAEAAASAPPSLNATGAEANVLQQQTTTTTQTGLVVESVETEGTNSLALKGRADAGATVKVSVDGKAAGEVTVGPTGTWSLAVDRGKSAGEPKIALELVGADGKVLDKTNFVYKTAAAVPPLAPQDDAIITHQTVQPVAKPVKQPHSTRRAHSSHASFRVRHGESLWRIARRKLGDGNKWRQLYAVNKDAIGDDPDFVRAGTRLVLPS